MAERPPDEGETGEGWQPPEPSGPEPDLGPQSPTQPPQPPAQPPPQQQPPPVQQPPAQQPPAQAPQQPPAAPPQAPPAQQPITQPQQPVTQPPAPPPPPGYAAPPPPGYPPAGAPPGYPPQQPQQQWAGVRQPGNGEAVAGFSLSVAGVALLFFSAGLSSVISLICSALGVFFGRRGKRNVDEGKTTKHLSLARAGFIVGLIGIALSILATVAWTLILVFADWSDDSSLDYEFDSSSIGHIAAFALRAALI